MNAEKKGFSEANVKGRMRGTRVMFVPDAQACVLHAINTIEFHLNMHWQYYRL